MKPLLHSSEPLLTVWLTGAAQMDEKGRRGDGDSWRGEGEGRRDDTGAVMVRAGVAWRWRRSRTNATMLSRQWRPLAWRGDGEGRRDDAVAAMATAGVAW